MVWCFSLVVAIGGIHCLFVVVLSGTLSAGNLREAKQEEGTFRLKSQFRILLV